MSLRLRVTRVCVGYWASAKSRPGYFARVRLCDVLAIPITAWDEPPPAATKDAAESVRAVA